MAEEDVFEVSPEDQVAIFEGFVMDSPPGQMQLVIADAKELLPPGVLTDERLGDICRQYNKATTVSAPIPGEAGATMLITEEGEMGPSSYLNSKTKTVHEFDHVAQKLGESSTPAPEDAFDATLEPKRVAILEAYGKQVEALYGKASSCGYEVFSRDGKIIMLVSATSVNLRNCWTGHWQTRWELTFTGLTATLTGTSKITTHYYENGNVQMKNERTFASTLSANTDPAELARDACSVMAKCEDELQSSLEDMYENMSTQTLREIRRFLPIRGKKMEWNAMAHSMHKFLGRK